MEKIKKIGLYLLATPIVLFWIGFGLETVSTCPDNTLLFVDEQTKEYFAPPCIMLDGFDNVDRIKQFAIEHNLKVYRDKDLTGKGLSPNPECRDRKGLTEDGRSLSGGFLEKIGLLPKFKSRWNADGTWNK